MWPSVVDDNSIEQTVRNIRASPALFIGASFAYLVGFVGDVLVAWALYSLLRPVNRSLAGLAAGFRAVQAVTAIGAALKSLHGLPPAAAESGVGLGSHQLHAHVLVLLDSFGYEWGLALVILGIPPGLVGYLMYRSGYIPGWSGLRSQ